MDRLMSPLSQKRMTQCPRTVYAGSSQFFRSNGRLKERPLYLHVGAVPETTAKSLLLSLLCYMTLTLDLSRPPLSPSIKWESSHSPPGAVVRIICRKSVLAEHLRRTHEPCHPFIHLFTNLAFVYRHLLGARSVLLLESCEQER